MPTGCPRKARQFTANVDRIELGIKGIGHGAAQR
jgi:hypothetical protein